jgi:hypothetical protein
MGIIDKYIIYESKIINNKIEFVKYMQQIFNYGSHYRMNNYKNYFIFLSLILLYGCSQKYNSEIDLAFSDVTPMVQEANSAFSKAEEKLLNVKPDNIIRPDPDPVKCPCKGTGIIKQGDGHTTQCPYHGKTTQILKR